MAWRGFPWPSPPATLFRPKPADPSRSAPPRPLAAVPNMKLRIRKSSSKHSKKTGYRTRQRTSGGRKVNKRQRARHGSF